MKKGQILAGLLVALMVLPAFAQQKSRQSGPAKRMYKCVDQAGKVYYSDSQQPDCNKGSEMNRHGVVVTKPEKAVMTTAKVEPKKIESATGPRRDKALLATYMSEEEIDAARDRSLVMPLQAIKNLEAKNDKVNASLFELKKQADAIAAKQQSLPAYLLEDVQETQKQQAVIEGDLTRKKAEADGIRARYESDKLRFRELKGAAATATAKN